MRMLLVRDSDNYVENVIEYNDGDNWPIPEGRTLIESEEYSIGDTYAT
jgi:hypothetical protein